MLLFAIWYFAFRRFADKMGVGGPSGIGNAFERATAILRDNRAVLDRTARSLLAKETLEERDLVELTADLKRST